MDADFTAADHRFRSADQYALGKYRITLRWLEQLGLRSGRLVNVGCGAGLFNHMAVDAGFGVTGVEPDPDAFALAVADRPAERCELLNIGVFDLPPDLSADVVVMHDVLEHIEDDEAAAAAIRELLAPGGVAIVSVPALPKLFGLHDEQLGHYRRYTRKMLLGAVAPVLPVERVRWYGMSFIPVTWTLSCALRRPYPVAAVGGDRMLNRAMRGVCEAEARLRPPIGTSLIALARRAN